MAYGDRLNALADKWLAGQDRLLPTDDSELRQAFIAGYRMACADGSEVARKESEMRPMAEFDLLIGVSRDIWRLADVPPPNPDAIPKEKLDAFRADVAKMKDQLLHLRIQHGTDPNPLPQSKTVRVLQQVWRALLAPLFLTSRCQRCSRLISSEYVFCSESCAREKE